MQWRDEWNAIAARIDGLAVASKLVLESLSVNGQTQDLTIEYLNNQCTDLLDHINQFTTRNPDSMPSAVYDAFAHFNLSTSSVGNLTGLPALIVVRNVVLPLVLLQTEVAYIFSDFSAITRRRAERAFLHLQRSLQLDTALRRRWSEAFNHETHCEKLGAIHLLQHGLYAFKVDGFNGRTDIMLSGKLLIDDNLINSIDAFVLTEWKLVRPGACLASIAVAARKQTATYERSAVSGFELTDTRYIVLVARRGLMRLGDVIEGGVRYKHINIEFDLPLPSDT